MSSPRFIMEFQRNLILTLLNGEDCEQVRTEGYSKARELVIEAIRRIMDGEVSARDLAVSKVLRRPLSSYARERWISAATLSGLIRAGHGVGKKGYLSSSSPVHHARSSTKAVVRQGKDVPCHRPAHLSVKKLNIHQESLGTHVDKRHL